MNKLTSNFKNLSASNAVTILFLIFLMILSIIYSNRIEYFEEILIVDIIVILLIYSINSLKNNKYLFLRLLYYLLPILIIMIVFKQLNFMIDEISGFIIDFQLIEIDKFLFGKNPSLFFNQIANPFITEILQISYTSYYLLPIVLAFELHIFKKYVQVEYLIFLVLFGFFLSYLGYFLFPAIGPRFFLTDFSKINEILPGLFFTNFIRESINAGEGLSKSTQFPILEVQRDAFPSGHTDITLIITYLAFKFNSRFKFIFLIIAILILISTIYLWYHYVIDLIAGAIFMLFTIWSGKYLFNFWQLFSERNEFIDWTYDGKK